jgi:hypothetical protein
MQTKAVFFLLSLLATSTAAFTVSLPHAVSTVTPTTRRDLRSTLCRPRTMASDGDNNEASLTSQPGKRRKRKDGNQFSPPTSLLDDDNSNGRPVPVLEAVTQTELKMPTPAPVAPKENVVVMKVRDIRDVISGAPEPALNDEIYDKNVKGQVGIDDDDDEEDDDELADDEEWEYFDVDENGNEIIVSNERVERGGGQDDSIEQLLADARQMRRAKSSDDEGGVDSSSSMKNTIFEVISTIVTVDFFVVVGLLVWFLAGIFCSSVLHNDAVQIAFNMNFERVTQP